VNVDQTLERIVPERIDAEDRAGRESLRLHEDRYRFAAEHACPGRLLDLACGVGYGTKLLAAQRPDLVGLLGVDRSQDAIEYARRVFGGEERVAFEQADAMCFGDGASTRFDTIVSLETVEHLPEPERFVARLTRLLAPGGVLIASVPTTPSVDLNPHHLHDFTLRSFREIGRRAGLQEVAKFEQVQRVALGDLWRRDRRFERDRLRPKLLRYYAAHPGALARRLAATLRFGFANRYVTIVWQHER
jgi:SAM-dependent methyltransferase